MTALVGGNDGRVRPLIVPEMGGCGRSKIGAVASRVGYGSPFALSTAFKRLRGASPAQYRQAAG
jgi:AraC-like DNA-binding protein